MTRTADEKYKDIREFVESAFDALNNEVAKRFGRVGLVLLSVDSMPGAKKQRHLVQSNMPEELARMACEIAAGRRITDAAD